MRDIIILGIQGGQDNGSEKRALEMKRQKGQEEEYTMTMDRRRDDMRRGDKKVRRRKDNRTIDKRKEGMKTKDTKVRRMEENCEKSRGKGKEGEGAYHY